ncbi:hypothetical protein GCM10010193_57540 [Kitasatospora atroaurantiaca]|uniref:Uncharacterized protein n=1 Tax=Kitasatospora atroaurantiaca TaxID=285545 RepID=A0A561EN49_9ACTN|nr:hypothetical protein [Kitasatospora atroaurantiaca]TWE16999.1 hypothetical protein FB465_1996 [Kitasatospora atroaurantiaca]
MTVTAKSSKLYEVQTATEIDCSGTSMKAGNTCLHHVFLTNYAAIEVGVTLSALCDGVGPLHFTAGKQWGKGLDIPPYVGNRPPVHVKEEISHGGAPAAPSGYQKVKVKVSTPAAQIFSEIYADLILRVECT